MIQQAIHHGLDVSIQRDTSNLMYRYPSSLRAVTFTYLPIRSDSVFAVGFGFFAGPGRQTSEQEWESRCDEPP